MNLTREVADAMIRAGWRPIPGRCIVAIDKLPEKIGSIYTPENSRELQITNICTTGTVLEIEPRRDWYPMDGPHRKLRDPEGKKQEQFRHGDRVILNLYAEDLDQEVVITRNEVILAVIEE